MKTLRVLPAVALLALLGASLNFADEKKPANKVTPPKEIAVEAQPKDAKAAKVVLVAGSAFFKLGEHDYVGCCAVLHDLLKQTPGVAPVLALDWPKDSKTFEGASSIVFFVDGAEKHPALKGDRAKQIQKLAEGGTGLVWLHQGVDVPKDKGNLMRGWAGAAWEKGYSKRAHWVTTHKGLPEHPIANGVKPFKIDDGYLYKLRFAEKLEGVTPLVRTTNPKEPKAKADEDAAIVAWAYQRPGKGRSFSFTGGHLHASFAEEGYRRFLVNGILWSAGVEVPKSGAAVALTADELKGYLTKRTTPKDK